MALSRALIVFVLLVPNGGKTADGTKKIDLRTDEGLKSVKGEWRFSNVKIVEVDNVAPDGKPNKTYNIEPRAFGASFDDSGWEVIAPKTLGQRRSTGKVCFAWYRTKVTLPEGVEGKTVRFVTTVDDYGELWVDGILPRKVGDSSGAIVSGFNVPNNVELPNPKPGKTYQIAVFGMNGPISAAPDNYIFLGDTFLEITDKK